MTREQAERGTILRGLVGSTVHGLNVNDGIEDRDEMGVCVEPLEEAMGLGASFEQFIYRSAAEREGRANARSTAGDLDLTIYIGHWCPRQKIQDSGFDGTPALQLRPSSFKLGKLLLQSRHLPVDLPPCFISPANSRCSRG